MKINILSMFRFILFYLFIYYYYVGFPENMLNVQFPEPGNQTGLF